MSDSQTDLVIQRFLSEPSTLMDFLSDVGDDPEQYGTSITSDDPASMVHGGLAQALAAYVMQLKEWQPLWADVDIAAVEWSVVVAELEGQLVQGLGADGVD